MFDLLSRNDLPAESGLDAFDDIAVVAEIEGEEDLGLETQSYTDHA